MSASLYINKDGKQHGPYEESDVKQWLLSGQVSHSDLAWREGMAEWKPLQALFNLPAQPPPLVPPQLVEQEVWSGKPSLFNYTNRIVFGIISIPLLGLGLAVLLGVYISRLRCSYRITNKRIYARSGIINVTTSEVALKDIRSVQLAKTGLLVRLGSVSIFTTGDKPEVVIAGVRDPERIRDVIRQLQG